ncbi:hypothetical protein BKA70DRAFT_1257190 [Coprinopsis sp. MPI-PUGE-AT-0042]|nr:hypothetical protein BKA70DRAFT_1257190 [Coprinopsis sp. MPI-PUGE-AT-0042]
MAPRRRCPTCGSRQWHKEPSSGLIACSEGHILQNYRNENIEVQEVGPHAMKKRTLKTGKKKREHKSKGDPKLYHGARGRYHYFLCLQLLLRQQVDALMTLWQLPTEFEHICRDIWALYLELVPRAIPPEPYNFAQQDVGVEAGNNNDKSEKPRVGSEPPGNGTTERKLLGNNKESDLDASESNTESASDTSSESDRDPNEDEIERLMRENSELESSDNEGEDGNAGPAAAKPKSKKSKSRSRQMQQLYESPANTIAILVIACWTLRVPVAYCDFSRAIESYELPYLDPVRLLPQSMIQHLAKHTKQALSPHRAPTTLLLHKLSSRLADKLHSTYSISIPEVNAAPLLWRIVRAVGGTPTLYSLTKRIGGVLSLPLTLRSSLAPALLKHKRYDPSGHQYDDTPPEVSLMACCIVAVKMVYGMDGTERVPRDAADPACALPARDEYLRLLGSMRKEAAKRPDLFSTESSMRLDHMSDDLLDEYLSFCEKALLGREARNADVLDTYFPLRHGSESILHLDGDSNGPPERPHQATSLTNRNHDPKPGESYKIWNARDVLGALPEDYAVVVDTAARWIGSTEERLEGVIETYEKRLFRWYEKKQRKPRQRMEENGDSSSSSSG